MRIKVDYSKAFCQLLKMSQKFIKFDSYHISLALEAKNFWVWFIHLIWSTIETENIKKTLKGCLYESQDGTENETGQFLSCFYIQIFSIETEWVDVEGQTEWNHSHKKQIVWKLGPNGPFYAHMLRTKLY